MSEFFRDKENTDPEPERPSFFRPDQLEVAPDGRADFFRVVEKEDPGHTVGEVVLGKDRGFTFREATAYVEGDTPDDPFVQTVKWTIEKGKPPRDSFLRGMVAFGTRTLRDPDYKPYAPEPLGDVAKRGIRRLFGRRDSGEK